MEIPRKVSSVHLGPPMFYYSRFGGSKSLQRGMLSEVQPTVKSKKISLVDRVARIWNFKLIKLHQSRCIELGLSFFALILLTSKLYDVNREVNYLKYISSNWLSNGLRTTTSQVNSSTEFQINSVVHHVESLKQDLNILIGELWSARTTLILSVVFVIVYILSWTWMSYTVQEDNTSKDISVKTILLLTVFAVVDIAASSGFVLVRIVMYVLRNRHFPIEMRIPFIPGEHNQLTAIAALRLSTLKSSSGTTDIFVAVIIGILTLLRLYSVMCAVSFYNKIRKSDSNHINKQSISVLETLNPVRQQQQIPPTIPESNDFHPRASHYSNKAPSSTNLKERVESGRRFSTAGSTMSEEETSKELKIQAADMTMSMQQAAVESTLQALKLYTTEKHIAESIKQDFDRIYEPTWHCIVGRNWGSCVTHTKQCYIRLVCRDLTILLYKST